VVVEDGVAPLLMSEWIAAREGKAYIWTRHSGFFSEVTRVLLIGRNSYRKPGKGRC